MDADGLTFACAFPVEERAARRLGSTAITGMGCSHGVPEGRLVSFGLAGALREDLQVGTVVDATRVVDASGAVVWEGGPLGVRGAQPGTILASDRPIDAREERLQLQRTTGADVVDMESAQLARSGRLVGCIRAVSDTPSRRLGPLAGAVKPDGSVRVGRLVAAALRSPLACLRAGRDVRTALGALGRIA